MKTRTFGQYTLEIEQGAVHLHYSRFKRFWMALGYLGAIGLFFIVTTFLLREYGLQNGFSFPVVMTFMFLMIILGATHSKAPKGFAGFAIGLGLTLIHLISIPVTNTSVNPARSTSQALFAGGWALEQLWLFWVAPIVGAILAGVVYKYLSPEGD